MEASLWNFKIYMRVISQEGEPGKNEPSRQRIKGESGGAGSGQTMLCGRVAGKLKWRCDARQVSWSRRFNCGLNV